METKLDHIKFIYNLLTNFESLQTRFNFIEIRKLDLYITTHSNLDKIRNYKIKNYKIKQLDGSCASKKTIQPKQTNLYFDLINRKIVYDNLLLKQVIILDFDNFKNLVTNIIDLNSINCDSNIYLLSSNFITEKLKQNVNKMEILNNYDNKTMNKFLSVIDNRLTQFRNTTNCTILLSLDDEQIDLSNIENPKTFITLYSGIKFYGLKQCGQNGYKSKSIIKNFYKTIKQEYEQALPNGYINLHYSDIPCPSLKCCIYYVYLTFEVFDLFELLFLTETIDYIKHI